MTSQEKQVGSATIEIVRNFKSQTFCIVCIVCARNSQAVLFVQQIFCCNPTSVFLKANMLFKLTRLRLDIATSLLFVFWFVCLWTCECKLMRIHCRAWGLKLRWNVWEMLEFHKVWKTYIKILSLKMKALDGFKSMVYKISCS